MALALSAGVFRDRNSQTLFWGQLISQACDKMMSVGLVWMFAERYSPSAIPWFLAFSALPHLGLAWRAGRWTAQLGQRRVLIGTDLFRGAVFVLLAGLWEIFPTQQLGLLLGASFISNLA